MVIWVLSQCSGTTGELGLDPTGITGLCDSVPLPLFLSEWPEERFKTEEDLFIEYHFLAKITLETLINRVKSSSHVHGKCKD